MTDFDILRDLIREKALAPVEESQYGKKIIVLKESGKQQGSGYSLSIGNLPDEVIAFKADLFPAPNEIFQNTKKECKRADFVLVASNNKKNWIVYIEMKSGNTASQADIQAQLRGAQCLVAYCRSIGQAFWREPKFLQEKNYRQRFISVKNISINKKPTLPPPRSRSWNTPENMKKFNGSSKRPLPFSHLVGSD